MLTKRYCQFDLKSINKEGVFEGNIAVFGNVDHGNDRIEKGAFTDSLKSLGADMPPVLWQHNWDEPIGVYTALEERDDGLFAKGQLVMEVQKAREAHALMEAKAVRGLSIGYIKKGHHMDGAVRVLTKLDLMEASVVTFPMNPKAKVSAVKSVRDFETMLVREAGFSRSEAQTIINEGYKALNVKRDADVDELRALIERNTAIFSK